MKIAYFYMTSQGRSLAEKLSREIPGDCFDKTNFKEQVADAFKKYDGLVFVMASGIVVRTIADLLEDKTKDPAVVVMDQQGKYAISLLSGHLGGANDLAKMCASVCRGEAVITTATDVEGVISFDTYAKENDMAIENIGVLKYISAMILDGGSIDVITPLELDGIYGARIQKADKVGSRPAVVISPFDNVEIPAGVPVLKLRPRIISIGIGCKKNTDEQLLLDSMKDFLMKEKISPLAIKNIATISLKEEEAAVLAAAKEYQVDALTIVPEEQIKALDFEELGIGQSSFVKDTTGVPSVSTACAYLASAKGKILVDKAKYPGITLAAAVERS